MTIREIGSFEELEREIGQEVAIGEWCLVDQDKIRMFAEATGDRQWIHLDVERAEKESPFGGTIAHGFLTLSLLSSMMAGAIRMAMPLALVVNYGLDRVRFISPVRAGARIRPRIVLRALEPVDGGWQATWSVTIELEKSAKPAAIAEWLLRYYQ